jgi:hypothetical protein
MQAKAHPVTGAPFFHQGTMQFVFQFNDSSEQKQDD